jgi:hypothetical protein
MKPFTLVAILMFVLVAFLHLLRLVLGWRVVINEVVIPMWASVAGIFIAGGLAALLWRESRGPKG